MRVLLAVVLLFGATGCAAFSETGDDRVSVAAGFYPLAFIAEQVGGEDVHVTNLTEPGQEPHDLELDLRTTAEVADADLVLILRGFQPSVDDAVDEEERVPVPQERRDLARAELHGGVYPRTSSTTRATASSGVSGTRSRSRRSENSTLPSASDLAPTVSRTGIPIRSASLNLTPGRSSRSS